MQCYQCARLQYEAELKQANEGKHDLANVPKQNGTSNEQKHQKGERILKQFRFCLGPSGWQDDHQ